MKLNEQIEQLKPKAPKTAGDLKQDDMYALLHANISTPTGKKEGDE